MQIRLRHFLVLSSFSALFYPIFSFNRALFTSSVLSCRSIPRNSFSSQRSLQQSSSLLHPPTIPFDLLDNTKYQSKMFRDYKEKDYTLIFVVDHFAQKVLLGKKKRGFGSNKWNGFGGKIEAGETPLESIIRELQEESGLDLRNCSDAVENMGYIKFFMNHMQLIMNVHVYKVSVHKFEDYSRVYSDEGYLASLNPDALEKNIDLTQLQESEEMLPQWFDLKNIPLESMWIDDKFWLPEVLHNNKKILARFEFEDDDEITDHSVKTM